MKYAALQAGSGSVRSSASRVRFAVTVVVCSVVCSLFLHACATASLDTAYPVDALPPLELGAGRITVAEVAALAPTPDLLAMDENMRAFVRRYTADIEQPRQRLVTLHSAIKGQATLGIAYDPEAGGTAANVFYSRAANCLSYASFFIALAREADLDAAYQWLEVRPQWTRQGERVLVSRHVNVRVDLGRREQFMVDIDPLPSRDITGSLRVSDADAQALHHSNIAMEALAADDLRTAWVQEVRALQISPHMAHSWVNLGAIYRVAGQHRAAEDSYQQALRLDPWEYSAMNNLVVLYGIEGRAGERAYWEERVAQYREGNPYYHAWLGDEAFAARQWQAAVQNYERAIELSPTDSRLLYSAGLAYIELDKSDIAVAYIRRAIDSATLRQDIDAYELQLQVLQRKAGSGS